MSDLIDIAIGELGYAETGDNQTKYGAWYGANGASWCHMFVSWCAEQAGISTSVVPKTASTTVGMDWYKNKGRFKLKGKYTPKRNDLVYFKTGRSHVGIVEKVSGNVLHTIEGNTSSKVGRRTYSLSEATITGYGVVSSHIDGSSSNGSLKSSGEELKYLKKILSKKKPMTTTIKNREVKETNQIPEGKVDLLVTNGKKQFYVPAKDGLKVVWERKGTPGKLTFEAKYKNKWKIVEGNSVLMYVDGKKFFYGFVFSRKSSKDGWMSYTVYDQLRYLKNKDNLIYSNKTATWVIEKIAKNFNMQCGKLADTSYKIKRAEIDTELFEIIQNALDETMVTKNKQYVLYDKVGKLRLDNVSDMKVNSCLIDEETAENYTFKTSIDDATYNQIKLVYENTDEDNNTKTLDIYMAKDSKNINKWGVLQLQETIDNPDVGKLKSQAYLNLYNRKTKNLTISGVIGNKKVRAGSLVPVLLNLEGKKLANYMLVEKVTHNFNHNNHTMDLVLSGGGFSE